MAGTIFIEVLPSIMVERDPRDYAVQKLHDYIVNFMFHLSLHLLYLNRYIEMHVSEEHRLVTIPATFDILPNASFVRVFVFVVHLVVA
jgi:hypothetical protein